MIALFTTDIWNTRSTATFHGIFETEALAIDIAKKNNLYTNNTNVSCIELELNKFKETVY